MKQVNDDTQIDLELREHIEEQILDSTLKVDDSIPTLRKIARDHNLDPVTAANTLFALVDEGILCKKRGPGFCVTPSARSVILEAHRNTFDTEVLTPTLRMARQLEFTQDELNQRIQNSLVITQTQNHPQFRRPNPGRYPFTGTLLLC